ncbi:MAG TPA: leucyl/phenylalanyl-tRNA--protein transferase [Kofleriaceae bacterium]|nr:leucyl/phenylalanyl-tRNA--protein transferase [Kofleriaceae bacterium]
MPVYKLSDDSLVFPPPDLAEEDGLLAVGGDLSPERLLLAYSMGIFPWYHDGLPILWHSPNPRTVLDAGKLHVGRTLRKEARRHGYQIRFDSAFDQVIEACARARRRGQAGTWITDDMREAYGTLHEMGYAHSAEAWRDDTLAGGVYGVSLGRAFFGESMFTRSDSAGKLAFVTLAEHLHAWQIDLIDCQMHTPLLASFGAQEWPRSRYLDALATALRQPTRRGRWSVRSEHEPA